MKIRFHTWIALAGILASSVAPARARPKEDAPAPEAPVVQVDGLAFELTPLEITKSQRTARGELETLGRVSGTVRTEKKISFRRASLPPGTYSMRIESEEGAAHFLVIEPARSPGSREKDADAAPAAKKKSPPRPRQASKALEEKEEEADLREGNATDPPASKESRDAAPEARSPAPAALRVPLVISPCEKAGNQITIELKPVGKGAKVRVTMRAGGTQARATLGLGDVPPKPTKPQPR